MGDDGGGWWPEQSQGLEMGNKLSSCGPLIKKSYRYDNLDGPFQSSSRRRDGHLLRYLIMNWLVISVKIKDSNKIK